MRKFIAAIVVAVIVAISQWLTPGSDPTLSDPGGDGAQILAEAFDQRLNDTWVEARGQVIRLLPDDNIDSRHQRFLIETSQKQSLLMAHNIDLAPRVPVGIGDKVRFKGVYEWNDRGGVIHWTHHDPRGQEPGGYIELRGKRYE